MHKCIQPPQSHLGLRTLDGRVQVALETRQPIRWLGDGAHPGRDERLLGAFRESA